MIDQEKLAALKTGLVGGGLRDPLETMSHAELRRIRAEIDVLLPEAGVAGLVLEHELVEQYHKTKDLMDETLMDGDCPANQKAQVANSVVSTLGQLVKLQEDLKREETLKLMESVLVDVLKTLPESSRVEFFTEYERLAKKAGLS